MKQVPIIRITEMLATGYAILARSVAAHSDTPRISGLCYQVEDIDGRSWRLYAEEDVCARDVAISTGARLVRHPTSSGGYHLRRNGLRWTVFAVKGPARSSESNGPPSTAPLPASVSQVEIAAHDSRALDRVGSWLAQPAGLPAAGDALGQRFLDQWQQAVPHIAAWHQRAECLHDELKRHQVAGQPTRRIAVMLPDALADWEACCRQLHDLLDVQQRLLGPEASRFPLRLRLQGLERLTQMLGSEIAAADITTVLQAEAG